ncbi:two-component response regulator ORR9 isoform X2 [Arachis duranensis]|uniref:Two-component response regulator ORR9 isoform X2 n=1 Tax=Arachis duranensis TaxID=130453 RepID=A0A9C6WKE4_ARADU|nr:two-component response regulator ORR9 isoform X2 [Arachis duranensis]
MGMSAAAQFHVLAVDDSLIDRMLIERLLKTSSFHVTTVDSAIKALQYLGMVEDKLKGYETPEIHQESNSLKDIPVVIMSSENVPSRINRCLEDGAEEFFLKPVQQSDVNKLKPHLLKSRSKEEEETQPINNNKRKQESSAPFNKNSYKIKI